MTTPTTTRRGLALFLLGFCFITSDGFAQQQRAPAAAGRAGITSPAGDAMISIDPETRQLIIVADDETHARIRDVVARLDRPTPQVLINVVFLEVTYRKGFDVGVEGSYTRTLDDTTTLNLSQTLGLPSTPLFTGTGAGVYQIIGQDFQATLRAIAEAGSTEVLSRPTILARNNQQAVITVGKQVPLITSTRFDTFGNQINAVAYQDVGIILRVVPTITSDGFVEMVLWPEISALDEQGVTIAEGVSAPVINMRSAMTTVVTPTGQTVVIGGLMENHRTSTERKIPFLGDIPVLGHLFKRTIKGDAKTELLIFLTPHIVEEPAHLAGLTTAERRQTRMIPKAFSEDELNQFLDALPMEEDQPPPPQFQRQFPPRQ